MADRLTRRLLRGGWRKGLLEGNEVWLVLGSLGVLLRVLTKPVPPLVVEERLRLGESLVVTHLPAEPTARAARRAARRAGGAAASGD